MAGSLRRLRRAGLFAVLAAAGVRAHGGPVVEVRAVEAAAGPPMEAATLVATQSFLRSPAGATALSAAPTLAGLLTLSADSPRDLRAMAPLAARLPQGLDLRAAAPPAAVSGLVAAYRSASDDALAVISRRARAELVSAPTGEAGLAALNDAVEDLAPYAAYGPAAAERVAAFAAVVRSARSGDQARELARRLFHEGAGAEISGGVGSPTARGREGRGLLKPAGPSAARGAAAGGAAVPSPVVRAGLGAAAAAMPVSAGALLAAGQGPVLLSQSVGAGVLGALKSYWSVVAGGLLVWPGLPLAAAYGLGLAAAALLLSAIAVRVDPVVLRRGIGRPPADLGTRVLSVGAAVVVAPMMEEQMFRGGVFLMTFIAASPFLGPVGAAAAAFALDGAAFLLVHDYGYVWPRLILSAAAAAGLLMTGSLFVPILIHALSNLANFAVPRLIPDPVETGGQRARRVLRDPSAPGAPALRAALVAGQETLTARMLFTDDADAPKMAGVAFGEREANSAHWFTLILDQAAGDPRPVVRWAGSGQPLLPVRRNEVLAYFGLRPRSLLARLRATFYRP